MLRRDGRVVALDHEQLRHRLARHRLALAGTPVAHLAEGLRDLVGGVVQERRGDEVAADAEVRLGQPRELCRDQAGTRPSRSSPPRAAGSPR